MCVGLSHFTAISWRCFVVNECTVAQESPRDRGKSAVPNRMFYSSRLDFVLLQTVLNYVPKLLKRRNVK